MMYWKSVLSAVQFEWLFSHTPFLVIESLPLWQPKKHKEKAQHSTLGLTNTVVTFLLIWLLLHDLLNQGDNISASFTLNVI